MGLIYLGPYGHEILLPTLRSLEGNLPNTPVKPIKMIQKAVMSDGTPRYALFATKWQRTFEWGILTYAQIQVLQGLADLNQELRFQDNRENSTWYYVVIVSFTYDLLNNISSAANRWYQAQMVIEET